MKKKINFPLLSSVRLSPISGETDVEITTSGNVLVSDYHPVRPRGPRSIPIAKTRYGALSSSPKGNYVTLKVILPFDMASEREFHRQVEMLFDEAG